MLDSLHRSQSISEGVSIQSIKVGRLMRTLFAGFCFSFANISCDCVFVANAMLPTGCG